MHKRFFGFLALLLAFLCALSPALAAQISGQRLETFKRYYEQNLTFINENANRHLLPLAMASRSSDERDGRMYYEIFGDVLSLTLRTDPTGEVIEMCQIRMVAPQGMTVGGAVYNDFAISGYHSYALLMAMDSQAEAYDRYSMVALVEDGLRQASDGAYVTQVGLYALACTRVGNAVTLTFDNTQVKAAPPEADSAGGEATAPPAGEDEGAGLG